MKFLGKIDEAKDIVNREFVDSFLSDYLPDLSLGDMSNVGSWADSVASQDRIMYQAANSSQWVAKNLSDLAVGGVTGDYLPLTGGTLTGNLTLVRNDAYLTLKGYSTLYGGAALYFGIRSDEALTIDPLDTSGNWLSYGITMKTNGNVGINDRSPAYKLSVVGTLNATSIYENGTLLSSKYLPLTGGTITSTTYAPLTLHRNYDTYGISIKFTNADDGLLGYIGIRGSGNSDYPLQPIFENASGVYKIWHAGNDGSGSGLDADLLDGKHYSDIINGNVASATKLQTARTIWGQSFDGTGNVDGDLYLKNAKNIMVYNTAGTAYSALTLAASNNLSIGLGTCAVGQTYIDGKDIIFQTYSSSLAAKMTILSTGNVGIGTTSPSQKLDVAGNITLTDNIIFKSGIIGYHENTAVNENVSHIQWKSSGGNPFGYVGYYLDHFIFCNFANGTENGGFSVYNNGNITTFGNGNFGIGTTSPNHKLHVVGQILAQDGALVSYKNIDQTTNFMGGFLELAGYYTPLSQKWSAYVASDYLGAQWCTTGGFTHGMIFKSGRSGFDNFIFLDSSGNPVARLSTSSGVGHHHFVGDVLATGGITMYSDQRKKTILNHVELSLKQIADAPLIEHYYNSDDKKTTHVGSIAQYWYGMNDWFCKEDNEGYLTMEIQNAALASAISIARELDRYEDKTDKRISDLEAENKRLKEEIELLKWNIA